MADCRGSIGQTDALERAVPFERGSESVKMPQRIGKIVGDLVEFDMGIFFDGQVGCTVDPKSRAAEGMPCLQEGGFGLCSDKDLQTGIHEIGRGFCIDQVKDLDRVLDTRFRRDVEECSLLLHSEIESSKRIGFLF